MIERLTKLYNRWGQTSEQERQAAFSDAENWVKDHPSDNEVRLLVSLLRVRVQMNGDLNSALTVLEESQSLYDADPVPTWLPELYRLRAAIFQMQGRRAEAFELLIKAYTSPEASVSNAKLAQISLSMGIISANTGDYDGASIYLQRSIEHSELEDVDPAQIAQAHLVLAQAQLERGAHDDAEHHASKSFEIYSGLGNALAISAASLLASIHLDRKDLDAAREILTKVESHELSPLQKISLLNLNAKLRALDGHRSDAVVLHDSAIELSSNIGNNRLKVNSVQLKCETLLSASQYDEVLDLLKSIESETSEGYSTLAMFELRGKSFEGLKRFEEALEQTKQFAALQKELLSQRASNALSRLRAAHDVLQAERDAAHFRERSQFYANELSQRTSYLVQQNEYINNVIDHIQSLASQRPDALELLKDIRKRLRQLPAASFDWNEYLRLFDEIHPNALAILKEEYPALTETESRVCSLVLAKLSNIEIGRLLSITERTVENHRHRLRKKLGLQVNTDLAVFLEQTVAEKKSKSAPRQAIK